ncbi:MAG: hypothetical protein ACRESZ_11800, partial [Methylococcales bacterium]
EDAPNSSDTGGDIWFARDVNGDGVAESLDHFISLRVDGSEATGMIFDPVKPTRFVAAVQHPDSTDIPGGAGDALWSFNLRDVETSGGLQRRTRQEPEQWLQLRAVAVRSAIREIVQ